MYTVSINNFKKMSRKDVLEKLPLTITYDNEPLVTVDLPENIITISDLHPRVRIMLKAQEGKARMGMPKPELIKV